MRNLGLDVRPPRKACEDPVCPFHGTLGVRGRLLTGRIGSLKANGMAVIEIEYQRYVKKYLRYERRRKRLHAHLPPCLDLKEGQMAKVAECRPLTKTVSFVVVEGEG